MLSWFIKPLRYFAGAFRDVTSPRRIAYAVALGMLVGLVPKANLTAVFLGTLLLALRVNVAAGACSALLFTWVAVHTDALADRVGFFLLTKPEWQDSWTWFFRTPVGRWSGLDNTVVLGNLALGLWLFYPVYRLTKLAGKKLADKYGQPLRAKILKYKLGQLLLGADVATSWSLHG